MIGCVLKYFTLDKYKKNQAILCQCSLKDGNSVFNVWDLWNITLI